MLEGKVALVTGASRGIGAACAVALGKQEATVIVNYNGSKEKAEAVAEAIVSAGGKAWTIGCDVADFAACEQMIKEIIAKEGRIDILVNNAGIIRDNLLMRMSEQEFDDVVATNLKGSFNTMHHVSRYMLKQKSGRIINLSSVSGIMGNAGQCNYAASKAGMIGMTKSAARELASRGVTVNAVAPGFVTTDMTGTMPEEAKQLLQEQIPMKRTGEVEDIANAVLFLASPMAGYITGQVLAVDGGMSM